MSRATDAYLRLTNAMVETDPECQDDGRFVLDDQPAHTLSYICRACPLFDLCRDYAEAERPKGGVWAGKRYSSNDKAGNDE